jgi:hypothetical protein
MITFRRYMLTKTPASALRWREDQANLVAALTPKTGGGWCR